MLNRQIVRLGRQWLPPALIAKLDPFEDYIARFAADLAGRLSPKERLLDAGAGEGRFRSLFRHTGYVGIDAAVGDASWDYSGIDARGDLCRMPFRAATFDHVLCLVVLEHTREPGAVLQEFHRVLRAGGEVHMIVPLMWEEHQKPHDYFRFTSHGIAYLLERANFQAERIAPIGGFFWVLSRRCVNLLTFFRPGGGGGSS